jgi:hypothetical protein
MSFNAGGIEYNVEVGTSDLLKAGRAVDNFSKDATRDFKKTENSADRLKTKMTLLASSIRGAISIGAIASATAGLSALVAGLALISKKAADANRELSIFTRQTKLSAQEFKSFTFASKQFGVTGEQFADISKDMTDKLGEFGKVGTGAFQDMADVIGITKEEGQALAMELQKLSGRDGLLAMVSAMEDAGATSAEMTFVLESMGNEASRLQPLLLNNGEALKRMEAQARRAGVGLQLTQEQSVKLAEVSSGFDLFTRALSDAAQKLTSEFAPELAKWAEGAISLVQKVTGAIIDLRAELTGEERIYTLDELEQQSVEATMSIQKLEDTIVSLKKSGAKTVTTEGGLEFGAGAGIKESLELEKEKKRVIDEQIVALREKAALAKKEQDDAEAKLGKGGAGSVGLTADQKKSIQDKLDAVSTALATELKITKQFNDSIANANGNAYAERVAQIKKRESESVKSAESELAALKKIADTAKVDTAVITKQFASKIAEIKRASAEELLDVENDFAKELMENQLKNNEDEIERVEKQNKARAKATKKGLDLVADLLADGKKEADKIAAQKIKDDEKLATERQREKDREELDKARAEEQAGNFVDNIISRGYTEEDFLMEEITRLQELRALELINEQEFVAAKKQLNDELAENERWRWSQTFAIAEQGTGSILSTLKNFGAEQSGLYRVMFAAQKGFAVAQAAIALAQNVAQASSVGFPQNIPLIAGAFAQGAQIASIISSAKISGGRKFGGPVTAGENYEINESGTPEVYTAGGKDYLMATQNAQVTPLDRAGLGGMNITIIEGHGVSADVREDGAGGVTIEMVKKEAMMAGKAAVDEVANSFARNSGKVFNSARQNTNITGKAGR